MSPTKILRIAGLVVALSALYAAYVAPAWEKKVAMPAVIFPVVATAAEKGALSPVIEPNEPSPPALVLIVTGDGQQADRRSNASVCDQPLACAP